VDEAGAHRNRPIARVVVAAALPVAAGARAEVVGAVRLARALRKLLLPRFPVLAEPQPPHRLCESTHVNTTHRVQAVASEIQNPSE